MSINKSILVVLLSAATCLAREKVVTVNDTTEVISPTQVETRINNLETTNTILVASVATVSNEVASSVQNDSGAATNLTVQDSFAVQFDAGGFPVGVLNVTPNSVFIGPKLELSSDPVTSAQVGNRGYNDGRYVQNSSTNSIIAEAVSQSGTGSVSSVSIGTTTNTPTAGNVDITSSLAAYAIDATNFVASSGILTNADAVVAAAVAQARVESVLPELRAWFNAPARSTGLGIITDSTGFGSGAWPRQLVSSLAADHPEVTFKVYDYVGSNDTVNIVHVQTGTAGERVVTPGVTTTTLITPLESTISSSQDIDFRMKLTMEDWTPASTKYLVASLTDGLWMNTVRLETTGRFRVYWADTNSVQQNLQTDYVVLPNFVDGTTHHIRITVDTDDGSGNSIISLYETLDNEASWVAVGNSITNASTSSILQGVTGDLYLGSTGGFNTMSNCYLVEFRDGIDGGIMNAPIDNWSVNYSDQITFAGSPVFYLFNGAWTGASSPLWTSDRCKKALAGWLPSVIISMGHNDLIFQRLDYNSTYSRLATLLGNIETITPNPHILYIAQNPWSSSHVDTNERDELQKFVLPYYLASARRLGFETLDVYSFMLNSGFDDSWISDQVHPTDSTYQLWAEFLKASIFTPAWK